MTNDQARLQAALETEAGGPIISQALARIKTGSTAEDLSDDLFGILIITGEILLFKHYAQANWFSSLVSSSGGGKSRHQEISLAIPLKNITQLTRTAETSLLKRLFSSPEPLYSLDYTDTSNLQQKLNVSISFCKTGEPAFFTLLSASISRE